MYHVHLIDAIPEQEIEKLQGEYFKIIDDLPAEGIVIRSTKVKDEWLTPDLLAISRAGVGVNTINVEKASENGTIVMNTPGVNANAVKELVLCCLLLSSRPIIEASRMVQTLTGPNILEQAENKRSAYVGRELQGKTIGLLGLGAIGTKVALSCYSLGMDVLGYSYPRCPVGLCSASRFRNSSFYLGLHRSHAAVDRRYKRIDRSGEYRKNEKRCCTYQCRKK